MHAQVISLRCAVLGDPIGHSLSPALHRAGYAELGLEWSYDAFPVRSGGLSAFLAGLGGDWRGLSLTMPLKREALALWDREVGPVASVSHRARAAGAVNTLVRTSYGWAGDNTDVPGAVAALRERVDAEPATAAILGAGATAASTGLALAELGARRITLLARDADRAEETRAVIAGHRAGPTVTVAGIGETAEADLLVSTVPADAQTPELVARWREVPVLFEVVYDPYPTPLQAVATGTVVSGLDLLVHQAVLQFELFTDRPAPLEAMRAAGLQALAGTPATPA